MASPAPRAMSRSTLQVARTALELGTAVLPRYAHPCSPQTYTQPQLFALLVVRQFMQEDYRTVVQMVREWSDLRAVLALERVPHYTTLQKAAARLLKKGALLPS